VNKCNPISFLVFPFLDCIRLKTQFRVKQQASNVLVETRYCYLGGPMFRESKVNHLFDEIPTYAAPAGCRGNNDVSNGATAANFPAVAVAEGDNFTIKLYYR
jgi:hypothetical protein